MRATWMLLPDWRMQRIQAWSRSWRGLGLLVWGVTSSTWLDACCLVIKATNTSSWSIWRLWRTTIVGYSWGGMALTYLYHCLAEASLPGDRALGGSVTLLTIRNCHIWTLTLFFLVCAGMVFGPFSWLFQCWSKS